MRERRIPALVLPVIEAATALMILSVGLLAAPAVTVLALGPGAGSTAAAPTPSDSGTPSPAPTGGTPTPTPSGPTPTPSSSPQATPTPSPSSAPTPTPLPTPTVLPTPPTTPFPIDMTSSALQVSGFTYIGVKTLAMPSGPIPVMEFSMADATFTDLVVKTSCTGHTQLSMSQTGAHATANLAPAELRRRDVQQRQHDRALWFGQPADAAELNRHPSWLLIQRLRDAFLVSAVVGVLLSFLVALFTARVYGVSMAPTLQDGDALLVDKVGPRYK